MEKEYYFEYNEAKIYNTICSRINKSLSTYKIKVFSAVIVFRIGIEIGTYQTDWPSSSLSLQKYNVRLITSFIIDYIYLIGRN